MRRTTAQANSSSKVRQEQTSSDFHTRIDFDGAKLQYTCSGWDAGRLVVSGECKAKDLRRWLSVRLECYCTEPLNKVDGVSLGLADESVPTENGNDKRIT